MSEKTCNCDPCLEWLVPHDAEVTANERERNLYTLKTMHEDLLDKAQIYNQLGQEREMFACKLAARYILGAIENIKEAK